MNISRRTAIGRAGTLVLSWAGAALAQRPSEPLSYAARLALVRSLDLEPAWFTSANWANGAYDPWTDYISGQMNEAAFQQACGRISDYCLRDIWNLRKAEPAPIDWGTAPPNWNGIHALAVRYFRTGQPVYLARWQRVVSSFADWGLQESQSGRRAVKSLQPAALLDSAFAWCGIFTATTIAAKGLGRTGPTSKRATPFAPNLEPLEDDQLALLPAAFLARLRDAFVGSDAPHLLAGYAQSKYVPNQRVFGLEALAMAQVLFPASPALSAQRDALNTGLTDVATRYTQKDGGQLEQSFNYARDVVAGLERMSNLPPAPPDSWRASAINSVAVWSRFTQAIALPDRGLPQLGNAATGRVAAGTGASFASTSISFPYTGIHVQRSGWNTDSSYLMMFVRRAARGHSMAGSNSVQVHSHGRLLLSGGGSADYRPITDVNRASAAYLHEDSSWKTSTVIVDGLSQRGGGTEGLARDGKGANDITRVPVAPIASRWLASDSLDYFEGFHRTGYQRTLSGEMTRTIDDVVHWRQVVFLRQLRLWLVVDVMQASGSHSYTQVWKLPPPRGMAGAASGFEPGQVVMDETERRIVTTDDRPGGVNLGLVQFSPVKLAYRKVFGNVGLGYFSLGPLSEAVPAVDLHTQWQGQGPQVCVTAVVPFIGQQLPGQWQARTGTAAAGRFLAADGAQLDFEASSSARKNSLWPDGPGCDLVVRLTPAGKAASTLVISAGESFVMTGRERTPITVPSTFRWETTTDGALRPVYV